MAVVKSPALSVDASGNMCGICYSRWRGMNIARCVWTGSPTPTQLQIDQQDRLISVSEAWGQTLTSNERVSWDRYASSQVWIGRLGIRWNPNGFNVFMKYNTQRVVMGLPIATLPVIDDKIPVATDLILEGYKLRERVRIYFIEGGIPGAYDYVDADKYQIFRAGPYSSPGRHALSGEYRQIAVATPGQVYNDDGVSFGKHYWYRVRYMLNSGKVGGYFEGQVFVDYDPETAGDLLQWLIYDKDITGDPVDAWGDQSDAGNDMSSAGGNRPTVDPGGILFDGIDDFMAAAINFITDAMWQGLQDMVIIAVVRPDSAETLVTIYGTDNQVDVWSTGIFGKRIAVIDGGPLEEKIRLRRRDSFNKVADRWLQVDGNPLIIGDKVIISVRIIAGMVELYKNESVDLAHHDLVGDVTGVPFENQATLLGGFKFNDGILKQSWKGLIMETYVFGSAVSDDDFADIRATMIAKYGI